MKFFSKKILFLLLLTGLVYAFVILEDPSNPRLPIRWVHVEGRFDHVVPDRLQKQIMADLKGGFFSLDVSAIKVNILKNPWIAEVFVAKKWPDGLLIRLKERKAVARWKDNGLVDEEGVRFYPSELPQNNLPQLWARETIYPEFWQHYQEMQRMLNHVSIKIQSLKETKTKMLYLVTDQQFDVNLGQVDAIRRLKRFIGVYEQLPAEKRANIRHADLRYTKGMSISYLDKPSQKG